MTDWPGYYFNRHNRVNSAETGAGALTPDTVLGALSTSGAGNGYKWKRQFGPIYAPAIKGGSLLYQGSDDSTVRALNIADGTTASSKVLGDKIRGACFYTSAFGGRLFVPCDDGYLYCLDPANLATQFWRAPSTGGSKIRSSPCGLGVGNQVAFADEAGVVHAVNVADGSTAWTYGTGGLVVLGALDAPIAEYGTTTFVPTGNGTILALSSATGVLIRSFLTGRPGVMTACSIDQLPSGQVLLVAGSTDHSVYCWNVFDFTPTGEQLVPAGTMIWQDEQGGDVLAGPSINGPDNLVAEGTHNWSNQIAIAETGYHRWKRDGGSGTGVGSSAIQTMAAWTRPDTAVGGASAAACLEYQIFPHPDYRVLAWQGVDSPGGHVSIWRCFGAQPAPTNPKFEAAAPIVADAHLYCGTLDGELYAFGV